MTLPLSHIDASKGWVVGSAHPIAYDETAHMLLNLVYGFIGKITLHCPGLPVLDQRSAVRLWVTMRMDSRIGHTELLSALSVSELPAVAA